MRDSGGYSPNNTSGYQSNSNNNPSAAAIAAFAARKPKPVQPGYANLASIARKIGSTPKTTNVSNNTVRVASPGSGSNRTPPPAPASGGSAMPAAPSYSGTASGGGGVTDDYLQRATNAVNLNINPQQDALRSSMNQGNSQYNFDAASNAANTQRQVNEQGDVYSRLAASLNGQVPSIGANYDQQSAGTKGNFDALQAGIGQNYGSGITNTSNEANRLGLQAATPQATAQMGSDQKFLSGLAGNNSALAQSNIGQQKAMSLTDALNAISSSGREGANLQGQTLKDANSVANIARFTQGQANNGFNDKINSLEGTRKGQIYEQTNALRAAAQAAQAAAAQQQFDNSIAAGGLGVKQQGANTASLAQQSDALLNIARGNDANSSAAKNNAAANAAIGMGLDPNSPEGYAWLQTAAGQKATADIANTMANTISTAGKYEPGQAGAQQYLKNTIGQTDPNFYAQVAPLFNNIVNRVNNGANTYADTKIEANKRMKALGWTEEMQATMMSAIGIAYNNTGDAKKKSV